VEKNSSISSFKKVPAAFLSAVALFFLIQSLAVRNDAFWKFCYANGQSMMDDPLRVEAQFHMASREKGRNKILLVGSSEVREGLDAERLSADFSKEGYIFYNIGFSSGHPLDLFMLKNKLFRVSPVLILYMHDPRSFYSDYAFLKMPYYFDTNIILPMLKYLGAKAMLSYQGILEEAILGRWLPLYKYRQPIKRALVNWLEQRRKGDRQTLRQVYKENKPRSYFLETIAKEPKKQYAVTGMSALSQDLFSLFSKETVSRGIQFIVLEAPLHPLIGETYDKRICEENDAFLKAQAEAIGFVYLKTAPSVLFTEQDFIDFTHLNQRGREKLTLFLEEYLLSANT